MTAEPPPFGLRLNLQRNIVFAVGEFAVNAVLLFVGYRLVLAQEGLEALGIWATLFAWINLVRLGDAGVAGAAPRFLALFDRETERARIRTYAETALIVNLVQFALMALLCQAVLSSMIDTVVGAAHAAEAAAVLPYMVVAFFLLNVSGSVLGVLQGLHLGYRRSLLSMTGALLQLLAVVGLTPRYGLTGLAMAQILQHAVVAAVGWREVRREIGGAALALRFDRPAFKDMLGYSLRAQVVNVANGLLEPASKMLVGHFGGMATQALFELAYKTVLLPRSLVAAGTSAAIPALTALHRNETGEIRRIYSRMFRLGVLAMGVAVLGLLALAPVFSWLWLRRLDETYWLYVALLAAGYFCNVAGMPAYLLGMATGRMNANIAVPWLTLVCFLAVGYTFGTVDVALVVVASAGATGIAGLAIWFFNRRLLLA